MTAPRNGTSREEFAWRYAGAQKALYAYLLSLVPHPADAEEVLQETAVVLWSKAHEYDPELPFLPWALAFARNQALKFRKYSARHRARTVALTEAAFLALSRDMEHDWEGASARAEALHACLAELPEADRQLLELRYNSQTSIRQLAGGDEQLEARLYKRLQRIRQGLLVRIRERVEQRERR